MENLFHNDNHMEKEKKILSTAMLPNVMGGSWYS